ncbi:MAG: hypothetical protein ACP5GJ_04140 [Nanopusillaceae archaeon]
MEFTKLVKESYNLYKKDIITGMIYGILKTILLLVNSIPIIGAYIYSYYYPRLIVWYYQNLSEEKLEPKYNVSFLSLFIPQILQNILLFISLLVVIYFYLFSYTIYNGYFMTGTLNFSNLIVSLATPYSIIVSAIILLSIFSLYAFYGSLFGKIDKYNLEIHNSSTIFFNILSLGLIFGFIEIIFSLLILVNMWLSIIPILLWILFFMPILDLLPMVLIKNL